MRTTDASEQTKDKKPQGLSLRINSSDKVQTKSSINGSYSRHFSGQKNANKTFCWTIELDKVKLLNRPFRKWNGYSVHVGIKKDIQLFQLALFLRISSCCRQPPHSQSTTAGSAYHVDHFPHNLSGHADLHRPMQFTSPR